jgi:hypothetical protein
MRVRTSDRDTLWSVAALRLTRDGEIPWAWQIMLRVPQLQQPFHPARSQSRSIYTSIFLRQPTGAKLSRRRKHFRLEAPFASSLYRLKLTQPREFRYVQLQTQSYG